MKRTGTIRMIAAAILMLFVLCSCSVTQKYALELSSDGFIAEKTRYAPGEKVIVYYLMIATDTDYSFSLSDSSVELHTDYDSRLGGYVLSFVMPEHDVLLSVSSKNSMMYIPTVYVTLVNDVVTADFWILPQTQENLGTSLWGAPTASLGPGQREDLAVTADYESDRFIIRIIDENDTFYSLNDVELESGYSVVFRSEGQAYDAVLEILDEEGETVRKEEAFTGVFGAQ